MSDLEGWEALDRMSATAPVSERDPLKALQRSFVRAFSTNDGETVLAHLRKITLERALMCDAPDAELRYLEGQRRLVVTIQQMIEQGQK